ncbi:MAG: N-acetyltransferase, partial [Actinomycetota bacterium]|nr:N-acetyltransferase [Actinomycetota bacterium]
MIIRPELPEDQPSSIEIERAAFGTPEEATIVERVRDEPGSWALVAEVDGEVVGHVQMSAARIGDDSVLALGPIGVLPAYQRRGIGSSLIAAALAGAVERGSAAVILLGSPSFYGSRGFEPAATYGLANPFATLLPDGFEIVEEHFQIAVLDVDRLREMSGIVRW